MVRKPNSLKGCRKRRKCRKCRKSWRFLNPYQSSRSFLHFLHFLHLPGGKRHYAQRSVRWSMNLSLNLVKS